MQIKPGFRRITFDTNPNDCNLHCIMCEHHSRYSDIERNRIKAGKSKQRMDIKLIQQVLDTAVDTPLREIIPSTMGEPLLYKDFIQIIELCKKFNLKLNLTTNGTFPFKGAKAWAELIVPVTSDIKISWNGATQQTQEAIMQGSSFVQGLSNIKMFLQVRDAYRGLHKPNCNVTLQLTFMETNIDELVAIVKMGIALGIDRIKGHHLWTHFASLKSLSMRRNSTAIAKWNHTAQQAIAVAKQHPLANGKQIVLENFDILDEEQAMVDLIQNGICPFLGREAWIAPNGRFSPCCAPDIQRRQLGDFGTVYERTLQNIWHSESYQKLCQNYMRYEVCCGCNMRRPADSCYKGTFCK